MGSLAKSIPTGQKQEPVNRIRLTMPGQQPHVVVRQGVWSQGPVYKQLDADFLQRPLIPRAPPAPRLSIDNVNGSLRVIDPLNNPLISDIPDSEVLPQNALPLETETGRRSRLRFQILAVFAGFAAGLAAALLLGWL
jgi:hypothetical protein